jgi:hypothetical protein
MATPIVDARRVIVGWTDVKPNVYASNIRHADAEHLVGSKIVSACVEISDPTNALRAGAPSGWNGPWRCMALCSERALAAIAEGGALPVK